MDKQQKLIKLIEHFKEHNLEHARSYGELVPLASELGNSHLTEVLERLSQESEKLNPLFEEALRVLKEK
jgi:UV DNA damage repair endonuclease